jgi:Tol biopolymer transport system component
MSPQQARGEVVDFRSDQFSLGLVIYEMVSGAHPFRRETVVQTMSAIIAEDARPIGEVKPKTPAPLRWIIERCLAKDPAARYASTADLARDLATLKTRFAEVAPDLLTRAPRSRRDTVRWALTLTALAIAIATTLWIASRPVPNVLEGYKYSPLVTDASFQGAPAFSPNNKTIAYVSQVDGVRQIFTRTLGPSSSSMPGQLTRELHDCTNPFWSGDGSRIYFHKLAEETEGLWSVSAAGGEPQLIRRNVKRANIAPDGTLAFFETVSRGAVFELRLMAASTLDGEAQRIELDHTTFDVVDGWLRFSPDGRKLLVWVYPVMNTGGAARTNPFWVIDWPARTSRRAFTSVGARTLNGAMAFSWMPDSRHVVLSLGDPGTAAQHLWMGDTDRDVLWPITSTTATEGHPSVSPDGRRLAFTSEAVDFDLVKLPLNSNAQLTLLATSRNEYDPAWSETQKQLVFVTDRSGTPELWVRNADGFQRPVVTADMFNDRTLAMGAIAVSPEGTRVAYQRLGELTGYDVWISTMAAAGSPVPVAADSPMIPAPAHTDNSSDAPTWSPDGWIALLYQGKVVKRRGFGGNAESVVLATDPMPYTRLDWAPNGHAIVYMSREGLAVVPARGGGAPRVISEEAWFGYVWSSDSQHVIGVREANTFHHFMLVAIDPVTGQERILNGDLGVIPPANQPIRGLARMGRDAVVTSIARARSDIWMIEGFAPARARIGLGWFRRGS